jgi:hypothetical protein
MKPQDWHTYFSPQEWATFEREAARRGLAADDLAQKYLFQAFNRIEQAEKYADREDLLLERLTRSFHGAPLHPLLPDA